MGALSLVQLEESRYSLESTFGNTGSAPLEPTGEGFLTDRAGTQVLARLQLERDKDESALQLGPPQLLAIAACRALTAGPSPLTGRVSWRTAASLRAPMKS